MRSEQLAIAPLYLRKLGGEIPAGRVVVHNQVRPTRRLGSRGFRAWLTEPSERLVLCGCDWAPELGEHYRVKLDENQTHDSRPVSTANAAYLEQRFPFRRR